MPVLPYSAVDTALRGLAGKAEGFGSAAIGGLHGDLFKVTTLEGKELTFATLAGLFDEALTLL